MLMNLRPTYNPDILIILNNVDATEYIRHQGGCFPWQQLTDSRELPLLGD